jgi:hypothetical protein
VPTALDFQQEEEWKQEQQQEEEEVEIMEDGENEENHLAHLYQINLDLQQVNTQIRKLTAQRQELQKQQQHIEHKILKRKRQVQASLEPDWSSSDLFPWSKSVQKLAYSLFGFKALRAGQLEIINAALSNYDVFAVMKTGGGKSLCYQLPALLNHSCTANERQSKKTSIQQGSSSSSSSSSTQDHKLSFTVVICPLLALIRDQVQGMNNIIPGSARSLAGKMERSAQTAVYHAMNHLSESNLKLFYVTPEKIIKSKLLMTHLQRAYNDGSLQRIVIDEVHCASQW